MSVRIMSDVWEHSKQSGGRLLTLLAISDNANDHGHAWPGLKTLSKKTRTTARTVSRHVQEIEEDGELYIHRQKGIVNHYVVLVNCDETERDERIARVNAIFTKKETPDKKVGTAEADTPDTDVASTPDKIGGSTPDTGVGGGKDMAMSSDPSLEPSIEPSDEPEQQAADAAPDDGTSQRAEVIRLYDDNIRSVGEHPFDAQDLHDLMDDNGVEKVKEAVIWAIRKGGIRGTGPIVGCVAKINGEMTPGDVRKEAAARVEADASTAAYIAYAEEREAREAAKSGDEKVFDKFKSELAAATSEILVRSHFDDVTLALSEEKATFTVPYVGTRYWLQHQAIKAVRRALKAATGRELEVEFVEPEGGAVSEAPKVVENAEKEAA